MLYAKVFVQILDSSVNHDWQVRVVFEDMLKLADIDGFVDMTHEAIARRTNVPLEIVKRGIEALEKPDKQSRSPAEQGRRIVRMDAHRTWGWQIVNIAHYRGLVNDLQKREMTRLRVRKHREQKAKCNALRNAGNAKCNAIKREIDIEIKTESQKDNSEKAETAPLSSSKPPKAAVLKASVVEEIYQAYPRKVGKGAALKAIEKALTKIDASELLKLTKIYASSPFGSSGSQYIPHPATWFNQERYNDDQEQWQRNPNATEYAKRQGAYLGGDEFKNQIQAAMDAAAAQSDDGSERGGECYNSPSGTGDDSGETGDTVKVPY